MIREFTRDELKDKGQKLADAFVLTSGCDDSYKKPVLPSDKKPDLDAPINE